MFEPGKVYRFNAVKSFRYCDLGEKNLADFIINTQYGKLKYIEFTVNKKTSVVKIPGEYFNTHIFLEDCDVIGGDNK